MYDLQKNRKDPNKLTDEELEVRDALAGYVDIDGGADGNDFVPTIVLYRTYLSYIANHRDEWREASTLSLKQFGAALGRVFPHIDEVERADDGTMRRFYRARRTYLGQRQWGYVGLRGPLSVRTRDCPGRPRMDGRDGD